MTLYAVGVFWNNLFFVVRLKAQKLDGATGKD
jgi:hypothetical protein